MEKSQMQKMSDTEVFSGVSLDFQEDFSQFLEEARQDGREVNYKPSSVYPEEGARRIEKEKDGKKSWKVSIFSCWRGDKKSKPHPEPTTTVKVLQTKRNHVSGPVLGYERCTNGYGMSRRPASGTLTNLFNPTKKEDKEIPYMCLKQLDSPPATQNYGPVYKVT